ncbi:hypothetical protein [endosymbiont GvMRE of Glomus versiforme]|uniref:hypothetical protein n=1 Tax=endosymbiont GvMRE of Glomus versiforme TaxID=2039283 RepID=UPI000ECCDAA3|nr:hypothetical protein [endosymbiont GvMRE of Glomus versiforme]RHZ36612.1 hypothetical protein GvMRE_I2g83 [endosymbiont GvMRE of Glomus versiforme]
MTSNNSQDLTKIIQSLQESNLKKDYLIAGAAIFQGIIFLIITLITRKRLKPSLAVQKIRKQKEMGKDKIDYEARMAKKKLELEAIEREIKHEGELTGFRAGLTKREEKETETTNFLSDLQSKGKEQIDKTIKNVKDAAKDKLGGLKDKLFGSEKE